MYEAISAILCIYFLYMLITVIFTSNILEPITNPIRDVIIKIFSYFGIK